MRLHGAQALTRFPGACAPPRATGWTWSSVASIGSSRCPQYTQRRPQSRIVARLSFRLWSRSYRDDCDSSRPRRRTLLREWWPRWQRSWRCPRRAISPRRKGKTPPRAGSPGRGISWCDWRVDRWRHGLGRVRGAGRFREMFVARRPSASSGSAPAQLALPYDYC
jgi:hypothetical protein